MSVRTLEKEKIKEQFDYQIKKERAIGVDPIFDHRALSKHGYPNIIEISKDWQKKSEEYDKEHL